MRARGPDKIVDRPNQILRLENGAAGPVAQRRVPRFLSLILLDKNRDRGWVSPRNPILS